MLGLLIENTDGLLIKIGKDQEQSVMAKAMFKNMNPKRLISCGINPLQEIVLEALGVDDIRCA